MGVRSPRYHVAPSRAVVVARNSDRGDDCELATLYWDLVAPRAVLSEGGAKNMNAAIVQVLVFGACCAAAGPLLFNVGASGRGGLWAFFNPAVVSGLNLCGLGTVTWRVHRRWHTLAPR